jgi:hypothetical protein
MAMKFIDGFDYLTAGNFPLKWQGGGGTPLGLVTGVYGKGQAVDIYAYDTGTPQYNLSAPIVSGNFGHHYHYANTNSNAIILNINDAGNNVQVSLNCTTAGLLFVSCNNVTQGTAASGTAMTLNQWYWLEYSVVIHKTLGKFNLYVNSTQVLNLSNIATQVSSNQYFNQFGLQSSGNPFDNGTYFDNFHCWDFTAGDVNYFPYGEHVIDTKLADAVGSNTTWNIGGTTIHANNYQQVNEANEDGDTTYVYMNSAGAGDIDSYGFSPLSESAGGIGTVAINTINRKDDAGSHSYEHYTLSSGTPALSSSLVPGPLYFNYQTFQGTDPSTSNPWTISGRNAAEFGYKIIS